MEESDSDVEALRIGRDEARRKLDHEIRLVYETDDTAQRIVRTSVIVLGIIVSVAGVIGPEGVRAIPVVPLVLAIVGSGCLLASVFTGIGVLVVSDFSFGVPSDLVTLPKTRRTSERTYLEILLDSYEQWTQQMVSVQEQNGDRLLISLAFLFLGIAGLSIAAGIIIVAGIG